MKTSKTAEEIAKYIWDHVALIPNDVVTIYEGPKGLTYTRGTMQHRDEQFAMLMSFKLMDEKPEDIEELTEWVEYQMKQQTED